MDILKEKIDANSFQTMKHIIFLTSTKNDKIRYFEKEEADKRFLPIGKEQKEEDAYTFQYPGEMLERYEEKIGDTVQIRRALAFALVTMNFLKLHLQPNQVLQLFFWIEESVYRFQPQKYFVFLLKVLEKEENLIWLPKEQAQDFWKKLMELGIEEAGSKKFRMLYMEKEEREKFYKEQEETAKQKKVAELEKQTKEAYQHFWKLQQEKTAEEIFWKIDSLFYSYQKEAYIKATVQFLKKYLEKVGWKLPKAAIWEYLKLLLNLGKKEGIEIATIKEWLIKTEVEDAYDGEGTHGDY